MKLTTKRAIQNMLYHFRAADEAHASGAKTFFGKSKFEKHWDKGKAQLSDVVHVAIACGDLEEPPTAERVLLLLSEFLAQDQEFSRKVHSHAVTVACLECGVPRDKVKSFIADLVRG